MNIESNELYIKAANNQLSTVTLVSEGMGFDAGIVLLHLSSRPTSQTNQAVDWLFFNTAYHIDQGNLPNLPIVSYIRCREVEGAKLRIKELAANNQYSRLIVVSISPINVEQFAGMEVDCCSIQELEHISSRYQADRSDAEVIRSGFKKLLISRCPKPRTSNSIPFSIPIPKELRKEMKQLSTKQAEMMNAEIIKLIRSAIESSWI